MKRFLLAVSLALSTAACGADDAANDACAACGPGTMCVQLLGGTCSTQSVTCKPIVAGCEQPVCSAACRDAYCYGADAGFSTCGTRECAEDIPGAFHCYGP